MKTYKIFSKTNNCKRKLEYDTKETKLAEAKRTFKTFMDGVTMEDCWIIKKNTREYIIKFNRLSFIYTYYITKE